MNPPPDPVAAASNAMTLAEVIARLEADTALDPIVRRDLSSAVRRIAALLGRDPATVPALSRELVPVIAGLNPVQHGIAPKTFANIKSNLLKALRLTGANAFARTRVSLSSEWQAQAARLPNTRLRNGLSRFMRYCSAAGIAPGAVVDDTAARFRQVVEEGTLVVKPNQLYRNTCHLWNEAAATVAGWPSRRLTLPNHRKPRESLSIDRFPAAFGDEVTRHLDWLANPDLFAEHRPPRPYKPRTVAQRRAQIGLAASALVRSGRPSETITSLADLVEVDAVKAILRDYHARNANKSSAFLFGLANMLMSVARHWLRVDAHRLEALRAVKQRLGRETVGLTEKNRATLKLLEDEAILGRLLALPMTLAAKAARLDGDRAAIAMQLAVAIEILIKHPPRLSNLAALRVPANLVRPDGRHGPIHLIIPEHEVKNGQPFECVLTGTSQQLIDDYLRRFRPRLAEDGNEFLFPARAGPGHKSEQTLSQQIEAAIVRHVGIPMTCHQFRHLAAQLILADNPGALPLVSNVLGHRSLKTAFGFYGGNNPKPAAQHYDRLIEAQRRRPLPSPRRRR